MDIRLTFTGDLMCDSNLIKQNLDKSFFDQNVIKAFKKSDYVITNLETPICEKISRPQRYVFSTPKKFAINLRKSGINCATTANNHCLDCGINGIIETIDSLDEVGIEHLGTNKSKSDSEKIFIKQFNDFKIAFLSYTYGTNAFLNNIYLNENNSFLVNLLKKQEFSNKILRKFKNKFFENIYFFNPLRDHKDLQKIKQDIQKTKKESDFVIFCLHSGGQYNKKVDHYTKKLCKFLINCGVDLIVGNHPHIIQEHILIDNKHVFYSLGNFLATPFLNHNQKNDFPSHSILLHLHFNTKKKCLTKVSYDILKIDMNAGYPKTCKLSPSESKTATVNQIHELMGMGENIHG